MPKQKTSKGVASAEGPSAEINDPRFSNFSTDPRFRLPSKKHHRTTVDKRFARMLKDEDFSNTATVDRYGRKLSSSGKRKVLERLYVPEEEEGDGEEEDQEADIEVEDDELVEEELRRFEAGYDAARGGGFASSEDDDEDDDEDQDGGAEIEEEAAFPDMQAQQAGVEMGEVSTRIAAVNLDWDNIRAIDLMAVFSSFVKPGGRISKISIYPSEFGRERMDREEMEGPPKEIFARKEEDEISELDSEDDTEDDDELDEKIKKNLQKEDNGQDFDGAALRQYQLERLRYYYAVIVCSDEDTARHIYECTDGTEYLSSANFFDLRFIPDGVEFDEKARDECETVPTNYKPTEFVTDALQHSKVKLTWDMDPEETSRKEAINRAFSGSRAEIGENDLRAYLGSDSEDDEEDVVETEEMDAPKLTKKEEARQKMRAALGLSDEPADSSSKKGGPVGDMEITFTAGLSSKEKGSVFENEPITTETTAETYIRKQKERKARRKAQAKAIREGRNPDNASEDGGHASDAEADAGKGDDADLGFDDPFFSTDMAGKEKASKSQRKEDRRKKREAKAAEAVAKASDRAQLELLMVDNSTEAASHLDHFDINEIARAEKMKKKRQRNKKTASKEVEGGKRGGLQESFEMDVGDERFKDLFENHEYAIDPSNPKFKGTEGMKKLLDEGRRKRAGAGEGFVEGDRGRREKRMKIGAGGEGQKGELSGLVEMVKKRSQKRD